MEYREELLDVLLSGFSDSERSDLVSAIGRNRDDALERKRLAAERDAARGPRIRRRRPPHEALELPED